MIRVLRVELPADDGYTPAAGRNGRNAVVIPAMEYARTWRGDSSRFYGTTNESRFSVDACKHV